MQTQVLMQATDGSWNTSKTYPNPLLAYIAARKLSRQEQRSCRREEGQGAQWSLPQVWEAPC